MEREHELWAPVVTRWAAEATPPADMRTDNALTDAPSPLCTWTQPGLGVWGGEHTAFTQDPEQGVQAIDFPWPQVDLREVGVPP